MDDERSERQGREIWRLPAPSQEFSEGPISTLDGGTLRIAYDYETETGAYSWDEIRFEGVVASAFTQYRLCSVEQIRAYDTVVEVVGSRWLRDNETIDAVPPDARHMRIFFDEIGCFDVIASDFVPSSGAGQGS